MTKTLETRVNTVVTKAARDTTVIVPADSVQVVRVLPGVVNLPADTTQDNGFQVITEIKSGKETVRVKKSARPVTIRNAITTVTVDRDSTVKESLQVAPAQEGWWQRLTENLRTIIVVGACCVVGLAVFAFGRRFL